ncbi:aldo/keto reductase [Rhizobium sp. KVB221]|uniref:Aldo/keto reductase n=1 Tax=Rhizobium setariae TaxID=2801340 RepID=A0A937CLU3_9HYPH|nr:aldo/keto reductase [Rhizobium setariae]MBL0373535.1 aldo/keto reductase [Rhizobium setariae]
METSETPKIRWGILGPGNIAKAFTQGIAHSQTGELVAIGTRNPGKPGLADVFPGARILEGYDALLADNTVDAVYIATPHPTHAQWAIKALEAGKHVLVEKPVGLTAFEAGAMVHAARKAGKFLGEAYMYRVHPQTLRLVELVASGAIGDVRLIKSSFGFAMPAVLPEHRLYSSDLAGGGIMDVGGYPVSMARLIAGAAVGKPFLDPDSVVGSAHLGQTGVDEWASAILHFDNGIVAEVSCSVSVAQDNVLRIFGSQGRIEVDDFWFASGKQGGVGNIRILRPDGSAETVSVEEKGWLYAFEADAAGYAIREGRQEFAWPGMSWADSLGNLRVMDKWRSAAGLEFSIEKPSMRTTTLSGRKLKPRGNRIPTKALPGLARPISNLALGFEDFRTFSSASILLDAFFEYGGNLFDTAFHYAQGIPETLFGQWQRNRGVREEIVIIGKGAHTPFCTPDAIGKQLSVSLDRLQTDHVDVYFMHRDNPTVPVGEFVDAMDAEFRAGRIRGPFGGSNWTRERMEEAIAYAHKNGKQAPGVLSNNFSLAEMLVPLWEGCVASSDDAWKEWLTSRQMPNFGWSSQGRGFFTDRAGRDKRDNQELVRSWYSEGNFMRRDRAVELAHRLGKHPIHVALAYVLAQPFPSFPLIGPRTLEELDDSLEALAIPLSPEDLDWLARGAVALEHKAG